MPLDTRHPPSLAVLSVEGLTLATPQRVLLDGASFSLPPGHRAALVGRNGGGKTTLLQVLEAHARGDEPPSHVSVAGTLTWRPGARCGLLPQHPDPGDLHAAAAEHLDALAGEAAALHARYRRLLSAGDGLSRPDRLEEYGDVVERLTALEAWDHPERRERVLAGLGLDGIALERPLATLSGGETTRLALAGLLLAEPDLLLLDEPTNNLDDRSLAFLEGWLRETPAAVLVVSHDRAFLDAVAEEVLAIDEDTGRLDHHGGGYTAYLERRREEFAARVRAYEEQQVRRAALLASAGHLSATAQRFQSRSQSDFYRARGKKVARRATVQAARVERQLSDLEEPVPPRRPRIEVPAVAVRPGLLLAATGLSVAPPGGRPLLRDLSLALHGGERVGIVGPSGAGKTTLLRALLGEAAPAAGEVARDPGARIGYLPQAVAAAATGERVVDHARMVASISEDDARALVGRVVFADVGDLPLARFSAGERRRIELAVFFASRPDLVVLDEPTNHLDLLTIEMLEEALDEYGGALLAVSHDRRFLENTRLQRLVVLDGAGGVRVVERVAARG